MGMMSIQEFNANVSEAIASVEAGEDLVLTRDGRSIARITREKEADAKTSSEANLARLKQLMEQGIDFGGPATYEERTAR